MANDKLYQCDMSIQRYALTFTMYVAGFNALNVKAKISPNCEFGLRYFVASVHFPKLIHSVHLKF